MLESRIEDKLGRMIRKRGGLYYKFVSPGNPGVPDRLVIAPGDDGDAPMLPEWAHRAIADWATWLMYRNGNPQKQQRGIQYKVAFLEAVSRIRLGGGKFGKRDTLVNVYAPKYYDNTDRVDGGGFSPFD